MEPSAKRRPTEISVQPTLRSMREKITYPALKESEPDVPVGKSGYKKAALKVYKKDFALRYYVKKKILKR